MFTKTRIYNAVILLMVVFLIDNAIKTKSRYLQLENEKSPLRDYNIENKENNTALLSAEDKISAAVHEPSTLPVVASNIPHVHSNLHPDNLILINISNFKININFDICNVSQIGLVTIVHTAVQNAEARRAIRDTWGHPKIPGVNTRLVFLMGMVPDANQQNSVMVEAMQYKDIVQGDFLDTYYNLSYKNVLGKLWVSNFCEQADFVIKTDDDVFVDLYATFFFTRQYLESPEYKNNSFILCRGHSNIIVRSQGSKWYVSYDEISKEEGEKGYPPFCDGWNYITTPGTAARLKAVAETTKFFRFDDVWVTGYLAKELKIKHLDMTQFLTIKKKTGLLFKSVQNPEIYHKDFLAILTGRNFEMFYTLHQHSRWCYFNKCFSNIYHPQVNLSTIDVIPERVMLKELS